MATIKLFEDLEIWQKAQQLAADIYLFTEQNPKVYRDFSFKDQIKRAVLSISNNIAEGFEYSNNNDFIRYLRFAIRVNFVTQFEIQSLIDQSTSLGGQIGNLIKYLKEKKVTKPVTRNP